MKIKQKHRTIKLDAYWIFNDRPINHVGFGGIALSNANKTAF